MRRPAGVVLATASLVFAAACGGGSPGTASGEATGGSNDNGGRTTEEVAVGIIPIVDVAPIYLGKEKGFFSKRGIELTLESGQGGAAILPGVVSGQFEFGFSNVTSLLLARDKNLPIKIVAAGNSSTGVEGEDFGGVLVKADSPIQSAKDLEGKTVAVNTLQNIGDTTVRESIREAGGDPQQVKFVELAFPDMPAALDGGRVDAAWIVEPFFTVARDAGARSVAWNFVDTAPNLMVAAYFTTEKLEQENPELVKAFTDAMTESLEYAQANPEEARQIVTTYTKIDPDLLSKLTLPKWPTEINRDSTEKLADLAVQDGLLSKAPDVSALLP